MKNIRNIAIIAHVDHGKTTLVDALLRQSHTALKKEAAERDLIMDSNELERERGITIFSKNASVIYKDTKINIIDTPGHADFGGEVERVLKMADGALLLIDAKDGPMPQTRFVLKHALELGLKIIVVVNKIDVSQARPDWVVGKTFDLFVELGADEDSAFFPIVYTSGKKGLAGLQPDITKMGDITPLFEAILKHIPEPKGDSNKPFQILIANTSYDNFKGRLATGKIENGAVKQNQEVVYINESKEIKKAKITSLFTFKGLEKMETNQAMAGDIVTLAGINDIEIGDTIADPETPIALPRIAIEEPTIKMTFGVNTSPFAGREGEFKTSSQIRSRLYKEDQADVALKVADNPDGSFSVSGRGELHLGILIERLRREGYEFQVGKPQAIVKIIDGVKMTPWERVFIEVPEEYSGVIVQKMGVRSAQMLDMNTSDGMTFLEFLIPTKNFFGFRSEFLTDTKGLGIINSIFEKFMPDDGKAYERNQGSLVAFESGVTKLYGLVAVQDRGVLFVGPNEAVYKGQVVGQNSREADIRVNVCKEKKLSNMRSKGDGATEHFNTPKKLSLEEAMQYLDDTELLEVTPKNVRIRKKILDEVEERRKRKML